MKIYIILLIVSVVINLSNSARILGIIPTASYSHQIPFRPLWRELHARGHHLTILTTDPMNDPQLTNLTEINLHFCYDVFEKFNFTRMLTDSDLGFLEYGLILEKMLVECSEGIFALSEVKDLIQNPKHSFDLLMVESQYVAYLAFSWRFKCPWLAIGSLDGCLSDHYLVGNSIHPVAYPDHNLKINDWNNLTFFERLKSFIYTSVMVSLFNTFYFDSEWRRMKKHFGDDLIDLKEIQKEISAIFVNVHPIIGHARATVPTTVYIGDGIHILPPKPLPQELQQFLDEAENGVIYFSLGSNVKSNLISNTTLKAILEAFAELPTYKVLWKFDITNLENVPSNTRIEKWVPQQDVLRHPNIKLFISQGGLQSLQEALTNHVPLVFIPFFGDQFFNTAKIVQNGAAVQLDHKNITKSNFKGAIQEVLLNPRYKEMAEELGKVLHDQPMTGLEQAIWWTEYIIRHNGTKYLRSSAVNVPFYQYYLLDIICFIMFCLIVFICGSMYCAKCFIKIIFKKVFKEKLE